MTSEEKKLKEEQELEEKKKKDTEKKAGETGENIPEKIPAWAQALLDRQAKLEQENAMLKDLAGKAKIEDWKDSNKEKGNSTCTLLTLDDKIVVSWGDLDYTNYNHESRAVENEGIFVTVKFLDGKEKVVPYYVKMRAKTFVRVPILENLTNHKIIELPDGKAMKIHNNFINSN